MIWKTSFDRPDESDQRIVVGVVAPTGEDRVYVATLPYVRGRVDVASTSYSETQLQQYAAALRPLMGPAGAQSTLLGAGLALRDGDASVVGQPVVVAEVTSCDPPLLQGIAGMVPSNAVQAWISTALVPLTQPTARP